MFADESYQTEIQKFCTPTINSFVPISPFCNQSHTMVPLHTSPSFLSPFFKITHKHEQKNLLIRIPFFVVLHISNKTPFHYLRSTYVLVLRSTSTKQKWSTNTKRGVNFTLFIVHILRRRKGRESFPQKNGVITSFSDSLSPPAAAHNHWQCFRTFLSFTTSALR